MFTEKSPEIATLYNCVKCHYKCFKTNDRKKHISTKKHNNVYQCLPKCLPDDEKLSDKNYDKIIKKLVKETIIPDTEK
jgi:hypothetical protein